MRNHQFQPVWVMALFCLFISISGQSQKISTTIPQAQWHVQELNDATGNYFSPSSYKKSISYLSVGEIVVAIQYSGKEWGAAKINAQGKKVWEFKLENPVRGIGRIGDNILLFYAEGGDLSRNFGYIGDEKFSSKISVALIDGKTGKQLKNKVLYDNGNEVYLDTKAMNRQDGSFAYLLVRVSEYTKSRMLLDKEVTERLESEKLMLISIDATLESKTTNIAAIGKKGFYTGAELGRNDDLYFTSITDDQLTVEKFNKNGEPLDKLATPLEVRINYYKIVPVTSLDPANPDILYIGIGYTKKNKDAIDQVWEFNFNNRKISSSGEVEYNKAYRKTMETKEIKELQNGDFSNSVVITNIIATQSRIAVIKELQYFYYTGSNNQTQRVRNDGVVIEIYDRSWKLMKSIGLDKKFEAFNLAGRSVGVNATGEKINLIMTAVDAPLKYATVYGQVDLPTGEVTTFTLLDRNGISNIQPVEGGASLWIADGVLIEYLVEKGGFFKGRKDYYSVWQKVSF